MAAPPQPPLATVAAAATAPPGSTEAGQVDQAGFSNIFLQKNKLRLGGFALPNADGAKLCCQGTKVR